MTKQKFDVIIVGGGSAGAVLPARRPSILRGQLAIMSKRKYPVDAVIG